MRGWACPAAGDERWRALHVRFARGDFGCLVAVTRDRSFGTDPLFGRLAPAWRRGAPDHAAHRRRCHGDPIGPPSADGGMARGRNRWRDGVAMDQRFRDASASGSSATGDPCDRDGDDDAPYRAGGGSRTAAAGRVNASGNGLPAVRRTGRPESHRPFQYLISDKSRLCSRCTTVLRNQWKLRGRTKKPRGELARPGGLEPPTHSLEGCCSVRLS